ADYAPSPVYTFIRREVPPMARLMLLNTNYGFFLDREYVADSFFEASQLAELLREAEHREGLSALFQRMGITHVLTSNDPWAVYPRAVFDFLADRRYARRLYVDDVFELYEL